MGNSHVLKPLEEVEWIDHHYQVCRESQTVAEIEVSVRDRVVLKTVGYLVGETPDQLTIAGEVRLDRTEPEYYQYSTIMKALVVKRRRLR